MRILVFSDVHGDFYSLKRALSAQPSAEVVIFCGDGERQFDEIKLLYPQKMFVGVRGNCDLGSMLKPIETITLEGKKIFITHGHLYNAKLSMYNLCCAAREEKADILLFGHTHCAVTDYDDGLYIMNPGSLCGYNATYGYIDITDKGVITNIVKL